MYINIYRWVFPIGIPYWYSLLVFPISIPFKYSLLAIPYLLSFAMASRFSLLFVYVGF